MAKQEFQTEVSQLLELIVHSLYSHPEIFLRELISNASDALDKLRHLSLTEDKYKALVGNGINSPRIDLELDEANKKLIVSDTGIGMNEEDLISSLGTIARSGTKNFVAQLSGDARKDSNLIGQFGVGFYSVFMVADKVEVISRKAGEEKTYKWTSDGTSGFDIEEVSGVMLSIKQGKLRVRSCGPQWPICLLLSHPFPIEKEAGSPMRELRWFLAWPERSFEAKSDGSPSLSICRR